MAPSHQKKTVGKRTTTASSPPGDRKVKRRKCGATHLCFIDGPPRHQRSKGQVTNSRPEPKSIYPGTARAILETSNVRPHEPHTPMH
ncbi:hypothetical protein CK203_054042 [Vitis vinifera]|uniref:Uncharacterized protein n=1 Tax=Vitis vinifera TaxID=29760 RepID=A0A438GIQ2_VITVI|nr:hypothetical protein CK203_054042 [Vitis vinifera]